MSNQPTFHVYVVSETKMGFQKKTHWTKIGAVFPHGKGGGFDVVIAEGIAVAGRLVCVPPKEKEGGNGREEQEDSPPAS